ncbi:MAG: NAD(+)/NADH kinase [Fidelibacterota bacterium]
MKKSKRFAVWANTGKNKFWDTLPMLLEWAAQEKLEPYLTTRIDKLWSKQGHCHYGVVKSADDFYNMDFILTLGGDGTILGAVRAMGNRNVPLLGIHLGDLGFLANVTLQDLYPRLNQVARGEYHLDYRTVLTGTIISSRKTIVHPALNDIVINPTKSHRMITCIVRANGLLLGRYSADGVIIATPTGSTAYSLAAGGPIVEPGVASYVVTPICPHTLTFRPVVVSSGTTIEITFPEGTKDVGLTVDGQIHEDIDDQSKVIVRTGDYTVPFIQFDDLDYFQMLRKKMDWGKRGDNQSGAG